MTDFLGGHAIGNSTDTVEPKTKKAQRCPTFFNGSNALTCSPPWSPVRFMPAKVPDLLAYSSLIVHAHRKFRGEGWLQYDRNVRKSVARKPGAT